MENTNSNMNSNLNSNIIFKESLLSSGEIINNSYLKTVPTTEINNIIKEEKKHNDIEEIKNKYEQLKNKINAFWIKVE